jgi:hypothetical protein
MLLNNPIRTVLFESNLLFWLLMVAMLLMVELGWRLGKRFALVYKFEKADVNDTFMAAIFGLLALLLAITFSGASDRFDKRRELISKEVSATGTAYQSIDLLTPRSQIGVRNLFKEYLDSRIDIYQGSLTEGALEKKYQIHNEIGNQLWKGLVNAVKVTPYPEKLVAAQILPETSNMFDASENQRLAMKFHPPPIIWQALICLSLIGSLVAGYNLGLEQKRDWFLTIVFILLMTGTIAIILNLEYPRIGFVRLDDFDLELVSLRKSF